MTHSHLKSCANNLLLGSFLSIDGSLFAHSGENDDVSILLIAAEKLLDLSTNFAIGNLNIVLGVTVVTHKVKETIIRNIQKLVFLAGNVGDIHVVGGGAKIFELLAGKDIDGNKMDLSVSVLSGLGSGHFDDLAGAILDHDVSVLPQGRALHGVGGGRASVGGLEGVLLMLRIVSHLE